VHYEEMQLLVIRVRKAAVDESTTAEELIKLDTLITEALANVDEERYANARTSPS
jgi:hypothetical protein